MEAEPLDPNKIAAEFIQANLDKALEFATGGVKSVRNAVRVKLARTYAEYLSRLLHKHSKAKSFFVRSEAIPLYDFFVPLDLRGPRRLLRSPGASEVIGLARCTIVTGSGGSGKSMIMRHLLVSALVTRTKTPVFLELRKVDLAKESLESALLHSLKDNGLNVDGDFLSRALTAGHLLVLLDGVDELERRSRELLAKSVQALAERYERTSIVVSSRPEPTLEGWNGFVQLRVEPLDLDKAVALVERLRFDSEIKARFVRDLRASLFDAHRSFLSNPLLLSIMLLTYQDTAQIPGKLSIFYNQAYESLFQKHDALKGGFQRDRRTALDIQDFAKVFAAFCVRTYDKRQFTFSVTTALSTLERCRIVTRLDFDTHAFLDDAYQAVCLLVEEGVDIAFAHRSFQEYFAARFVADSSPQTKEQLIRRLGANQGVDAFITLLHEIDPFAVQKYYLLPALDNLRNRLEVKKKVGAIHHFRFLQTLFSGFSMSSDPDRGLGATLKDAPLFHALRFAVLSYGPESRYGPNQNRTNDGKLEKAFADSFGERADDVSLRSMTSRHPFIREVAASTGWWGIDHVTTLIDLASVIRGRLAESESSVDTILG